MRLSILRPRLAALVLILLSCPLAATPLPATPLRVATFNIAWLADRPLPDMAAVRACEAEARAYPDLDARPTPSCRQGRFRTAAAYRLLARHVASLQADLIAFEEVAGAEALRGCWSPMAGCQRRRGRACIAALIGGGWSIRSPSRGGNGWRWRCDANCFASCG